MKIKGHMYLQSFIFNGIKILKGWHLNNMISSICHWWSGCLHGQPKMVTARGAGEALSRKALIFPTVLLAVREPTCMCGPHLTPLSSEEYSLILAPEKNMLRTLKTGVTRVEVTLAP